MKERGLTLIEVIVILLIVGILAAIALPAFIGHPHHRPHDIYCDNDDC